MYVGLFGRDTMLAAWQAALAGPELLRGTLPHLARLQGRRIDDWRHHTARVDVHGIESLPAAVQTDARAAVTDAMPLKAPFDEEKLDQASKALAAVLGDNGYAQALVRKRAEVNLHQYVAAAGFWVEAGKPAEIGEVKLQGLGDLPEDRVRGALSLEPGMPYSQSELDESKRQLLDLGVFSSVEIEPQIDAASPGPNGKLRVPILVKLEKAKCRKM